MNYGPSSACRQVSIYVMEIITKIVVHSHDVQEVETYTGNVPFGHYFGLMIT